jgi:hypothetical protein
MERIKEHMQDRKEKLFNRPNVHELLSSGSAGGAMSACSQLISEWH